MPLLNPGQLRLAGLCGVAVAVAIALTTVPTAETAEPPSPVTQGPAGTPAQSGYVGDDTCLTCHDDQNLKGTAHARAADLRTPAAAHGCETCHGPGQAHVEASGDKTKIRAFSTLAPAATSEACVTCHKRGDHAFWNASAHALRSLSCTSCHSVHTPKSIDGQLKVENQIGLCAQCHRDKAAKLDRSGHMPVREGKMVCSTCHNVHGSANVRLLRAGYSINESCTRCHAEKRGPFLWEHAAVRENCASCHDPHGSPNERMLITKQPFLCQRCHSATRHPGTLYDNTVVRSSNRIFSRSCVTCHANIHGSNHPSGSTFLR